MLPQINPPSTLAKHSQSNQPIKKKHTRTPENNTDENSDSSQSIDSNSTEESFFTSTTTLPKPVSAHQARLTYAEVKQRSAKFFATARAITRRMQRATDDFSYQKKIGRTGQLPPLRLHKKDWDGRRPRSAIGYKGQQYLFGIKREKQIKDEQRKQNAMAKNRLWNGSRQIQSKPHERTVHGISRADELDPKKQKKSACKRHEELEHGYNLYAAYQM